MIDRLTEQDVMSASRILAPEELRRIIEVINTAPDEADRLLKEAWERYTSEANAAAEALISCGPTFDVPTDEDLKSRGPKVRY